MTAAALERAFPTFPRGQNRDDILRAFRLGMRAIVNPDTGLAFTEREIATATCELSRYYEESDGVDLVLLSGQQRAIYLADQTRMDRACAAWLKGYHGVLWGVTQLPATGGSGPVEAPALTGTIFAGSTTIPDLAACQATDPAGKTYQVLYTETAGGSPAHADLVMQAVDTGDATNLAVGTELKWANLKPAGADPTATVTTTFTGGLPAETMAQFAQRLMSLPKSKPASGNSAHMRSWARASTNAVENAFVYSCALHAGTTIICVTQKRGSTLGPTGRIPSLATLATVTSFLVPPGSPVVPKPPLVIVVPPVGQSSNLVASLALPCGQDGGWKDLEPWPRESSGGACTITNLTTQTSFQITREAGSASPTTSAPALMAWNATTSRWESLLVQSVTLNAGDVYDVVLSSAPTMTLATGQYISPDTEQRDLIAQTIELYFDSLGPGELVASTDSRMHRAFRDPRPSDESPSRAGTSVLTWLSDALGSLLADSSLDSISSSTPTVPADPTAGPSMMVAGKVGIYPLSI
jgi:hypothetical protein